jgi:hypothetical protein
MPLEVYHEHLTHVTWERACHDGDVAVYELNEHGGIALVAFHPKATDLADAYREALAIERQLHDAAWAAAVLE